MLHSGNPAEIDGVADGVRTYAFGRFRLDPERGALLRDGNEVALRPKSYEVLRHLLSRAGTLVSREELFHAVWPDRIVTDDSLTQCIVEIRKALSHAHKDVIRTVPRRGYIFQAEVEVLHRGAPESSVSVAPRDKARSRLPSRWTMVGLAVLAVAVVATWWRLEIERENIHRSAKEWRPAPASIAVLPFADMSEAGDQQYLADGIAEEIINLLAQSPGLTVIARTSSFAVAGGDDDIPAIARRLDVAHVLEGSVRKAGDELRVTAQLVEGQTGAHIWSQIYNDRLDEVFGVQDRIAGAVAQVLQLELNDELAELKKETAYHPDPRAWEAYLRGQLFYNRRTDGDILRAQRSFEKALEIDPGFAVAWTSLAATMNLRRADVTLEDELRLPQEEALPLIRQALEQALALDPHNPEALWRYSRFTWKADGDVETTLDLKGRAMELGRNHALLQAMMGGFAYDTGHPELALPFIRRAVMLDPVNPAHRNNLGNFLLAAGRMEEAEAVLTQVIEITPGYADALGALTQIQIYRGDLRSAAELNGTIPPGPNRDLNLAILDGLTGKLPTRNKAMARFSGLPPEEGAIYLAQVHAMRGEIDEAFRQLSIATRIMAQSPLGRSARHHLTTWKHMLFLEPLHDDQRWATWSLEVSALLLDEVDYEVVSMLRDHLERHAGLYASAVPGPGTP